MANLRARIDALRHAFGRLTQRDQFMVVGTSAAVVLLVLFIIGLWVSSAISRAEHRVKVKTDELTRVLEQQGQYRAKKRQHQRQIMELTRSHVSLVSLVSDAARQAGVDIGQLHQQDNDPNSEGIIESEVDLRASNLSINRLQDFLNRLKKTPGLVLVQRLKVEKPYRKDTLNIDMTVTTYKMKSSAPG